MESKIRLFEDIVSQLQFQQDSCRPYMKLAKDSTSLSKLQQTLNTLKKQNQELEHEYQSNQDSLEEMQSRAEYAQQFSNNWIETEHSRREETLSRIDLKLAQLQGIFRTIGKESSLTMQQVGERLKTDIYGMTHHAKEKFARYKNEVTESLEVATRQNHKDIEVITKAQNDTAEKLSHFEQKYSGVIKNFGAKGEHTHGTDELKRMMIEEIKAKIQQSVDECKQQFDHKIKNLCKKFNEEILRIQAKLEDIKT